jgi:hypothetical protein
VVLVLLLLLQTPAASCADVADCRARAQTAVLAGDFETFHDFTWRAVQRGNRNDPELMGLLARAQALSGRLGDALVTLSRLARPRSQAHGQTRGTSKRPCGRLNTGTSTCSTCTCSTSAPSTRRTPVT